MESQKITINRPKVYNAFRPLTNKEMLDAFAICRERSDIRVIILTGIGDKAFCSGGDQNAKGHGGYVDETGVPRLNVLELHHAIRSDSQNRSIAMVNGYSIGGGNVLQVVCDLSIASENARFGQTISKSRQFRCRFRFFLSRTLCWPEEGSRNLVSLPPVYGSGSFGNGNGQRCGSF